MKSNADLPAGVQPFIYAGFEGTPGKESDVAGKHAAAGFTSRVVDNSPIDDRVFQKVKNAFRGDRGEGGR